MPVRVLDLFCGAGGAGMGYHQAGFEVVGVDINPQPNYPFEFHQADAMTYPIEGFDLIHASPPCQAYSQSVRSTDSKWVPTRGKLEPKLIGGIRERIKHQPYVIENVLGAVPYMDNPVMLCGLTLGLVIPRHRFFESNFNIEEFPHEGHKGYAKKYARENNIEYRDMTVTGKGRHAGTSDRWKSFMGIDWYMTQPEIVESLPPAYSKYIGEQFYEST